MALLRTLVADGEPLCARLGRRPGMVVAGCLVPLHSGSSCCSAALRWAGRSGVACCLIKGQRATLREVSDQIRPYPLHMWSARTPPCLLSARLVSLQLRPWTWLKTITASRRGCAIIGEPPRHVSTTADAEASARSGSRAHATDHRCSRVTDGGVYDNIGRRVAVELPRAHRPGSRNGRPMSRGRDLHFGPPLLGEAAERLSKRAPNFHVVANASGSLGFLRFAWTTFLPLVGELLFVAPSRKSILYDDGHTMRRRFLVRSVHRR